MSPMLKFITRRLLAIPLTMLMVTALLYGIIMQAPPETRAKLYLSKGSGNNPHALSEQEAILKIIEEKNLDAPYLVQYSQWASELLKGNWGWSQRINDYVLDALLTRTPATAELTFYSVLFLIPLGIISGVIAGWRNNRPADHGFRIIAFIATSIPPFILGLVLLSVFYAGLGWLQPGRMTTAERFLIESPTFRSFTGLITIDSLLNGRLDITKSAFRHLIMPAVTLSLVHWATLARVTRAAIIEELNKEYIVAARGRGIRPRHILWRHALRNALVPGLNSIALSAAALIMGVFVVEVIYNFPGVSELITRALVGVPDTAVAMGFSIYSILLVLPVMFFFDILQAIVDPRIREGALQS